MIAHCESALMRTDSHPLPSGSVAIIAHPQRYKGAWLFVARAAWFAVVLPVLAMYTFGLSGRVSHLVQVTPFASAFQLRPQDVAALAQLGLSPSFYLNYILSLELLVATSSLAVAMLIFWRRSNNTAAIIVFATDHLPGLHRRAPIPTRSPNYPYHVEVLRRVLQAIGIGLSVIMCYLFPDGRFVPHWTRALAMIWATILLVWLAFPISLLNPLPNSTSGTGRLPVICLCLAGLPAGSPPWYTATGGWPTQHSANR